MKKVKIFSILVLLMLNVFLTFSPSSTKGNPIGGYATKGYKSSFNGTMICNCPTYSNFDCYCAG